jgi:hypothetical protein
MTTWLRVASLGVAAGLWLRGRNDAVGWKDVWGPPTWQQTYVPILAVAVGLYAHWWFLSWLTRRRLKQTGWRATRVVWPTAAVALVSLVALAGFANAPDGVLATLAIPAVAVNLPLFPLASLLSWLSESIPWWILAPAGTVAAWSYWWAIIVFFERRARNAGPLTLGTHLT